MTPIKKRSISYDRKGTPTYLVNGVVVTEGEFDMPDKPVGCPLAGHQPACWPLVSDALAVHPDQIAEATTRNKRHGVSVGYLPDGRAVLPDRHERSKILRLEGFHDKSAGYGD